MLALSNFLVKISFLLRCSHAVTDNNPAILSSPDLPGEPSKLRVVDSTKTSITLGWEKPVYDGGSEITHYMLEQMNTEDREWVTINPQVKTCEYVVSYLKPGSYYFFRVSAVNCKGKGEDIKMYQPVQAKDILGLSFIL